MVVEIGIHFVHECWKRSEGSLDSISSELDVEEIYLVRELASGIQTAYRLNGKIKPVNIGGVIVTSATLHNKDFISGFDNKGNKIRDGVDIRIGDWVTVYRAGDVIPKIKDVDVSKRNTNSEPFAFPHFCPSCNSKVEIDKG